MISCLDWKSHRKQFAQSDFKKDELDKYFTRSEKTEEHPQFGPTTFYHIDLKGVHLENVAWEFKDSQPAEDAGLKDWLGFSRFSIALHPLTI
jgi:uncharacterized protein (DUF427 family)